MTRKTLLVKIYRQDQLSLVNKKLKKLLENLDVKIEVAGIAAKQWPQIEISGEDEGIATSLVALEIGFCPETVQAIRKFEVLKGYVSEIEDDEGLNVDVGILEPSGFHARVPPNNLRAQLVDGRVLDTTKLAQAFGVCRDLPIYIKVNEIDLKKGLLSADLSTKQLLRFESWISSLLDRLIVVDASYDEIRKTLDYTGLSRDVINVEPLGIFEHALTCKLGTDAAGLVSIVGRRMRNAKITVFNSRMLWRA